MQVQVVGRFDKQRRRQEGYSFTSSTNNFYNYQKIILKTTEYQNNDRTMGIPVYKKYVYYFKTIGACIVVVGSCGFLYHYRDSSKFLRFSLTSSNMLNSEPAQVQYIYLDDPRFKDLYMFHTEKRPQKSLSHKPKSLSSILTKWWKSLNRNLAHRYLNIAKNGSKHERLKAVASLGSLEYLKDWHYHQLAMMIDAKTAVALARTPDCDLRFFLKPPYYHVEKKLYETIEELYELLSSMDKLCKSHHRCLTQFISKKFLECQRETLEFDHDLVSVGLTATPAITWNEQLLMSCIEAIYHHSSIDQFSRDFADAGGLPVLVHVQKKFANNVNICILLAKIISNLTLYEEYLENIFESGWIGILAAWSRHTDARLAGPAARALINLDKDANNDEKFPRRIYLLHPMRRTQTTAKLDVVFIHGLLGGVFVTWRQRDPDPTIKFVDKNHLENDTLTNVIGENPQEFLQDLARDLQKRNWQRLGDDFEVVLHDCPVSMNDRASGPFTCSGEDVSLDYEVNGYCDRTECWPKDWLPKDVPSIRVIGINYDTNLSYWRLPCHIESMRSTMNERSVEFSSKLITAGVGKRPIIWICHSMGGLLVKQMLVEEWKKGDTHKLCENTKGIIFYSTPHRGSHIAALKQTTQMLVWPSVEVQELREESPKLLKLHEDFLNMLEKYTMEIISFSETKSTLLTALKFPFQFVKSKSADPGVGEFYEIPQDHLSICKPANRQSFLYRKVLNVLHKTTEENSSRSHSFIDELSKTFRIF